MGGGQGQRGRFDRNTTAAARGFNAGKGSRVGEVRTTLKGEIETERYVEQMSAGIPEEVIKFSDKKPVVAESCK